MRQIALLLVLTTTGLGGCVSADCCKGQYGDLRAKGAPRIGVRSPLAATLLAFVPHGAPGYIGELDRRPFGCSILAYPICLPFDLATAGSRASAANQCDTVEFYTRGPGAGWYERPKPCAEAAGSRSPGVDADPVRR